MLSIIRYGVLEKMQADVRKISVQHLSNRSDSNFNSKDIRTLREEEKSLSDKIQMLSRNPRNHNTVADDQLDVLKKKKAFVMDAINKKQGKDTAHLEKEATKKLLEGANIVCTTINSSINLKT